jgi:6,7-dimethyl-8-ribityllumazine synthase
VIREVVGEASGEGLHVGLAVAMWNQTITDRLLAGAKSRCEQLGVTDVTVLRVPGALELPVAALALADEGCDAVVAIGAVVRGDTDHYDIVVRESSAGVARVALETGVPVTNAILAVHDVSQAMARSEEGGGNRAAEAVEAAVITARALAALREK